MWAGCPLGLLNNHYSRTALYCSLMLGPGPAVLFEEETKIELSGLLRSNTHTRRGRVGLDTRAVMWCCTPNKESTSPRAHEERPLERPRGSRKAEVLLLPSCSVSDQGPPQEERDLGSKLKRGPEAARERLSANRLLSAVIS